MGCEVLRIPHCLDNRLTDDGKVVTALRTRRTLLPRNIIIFMFWYPFLLEAESKSQGLVRPEGLGKFKKITSSEIEPATYRFVA
jgi:hypothetical protein